jgi:hypothetical protein
MDRKITRFLVALLTAFALFQVACGPSAPARGSTWNTPKSSQTAVRKDADYAGSRFNTILVIGVTNSKTIREALENKFVAMLKEQDAGAVASYQVLPQDQEINRELIQQYIIDTGIDGVLVTRLKARGTEISEPIKTNANTPPPEPMETQLGSRDFYGYYSLTYRAVRATDFPSEDQFVELETKLFEVKEGKEVWSATRKTKNPTSAMALIKELGNVIISELSKENLI